VTQKILTDFLGLKTSAEGLRLSEYGRRSQLESHPLLSSTAYELQDSSVLEPVMPRAELALGERGLVRLQLIYMCICQIT
jgi:hypothetical protein